MVPAEIVAVGGLPLLGTGKPDYVADCARQGARRRDATAAANWRARHSCRATSGAVIDEARIAMTLIPSALRLAGMTLATAERLACRLQRFAHHGLVADVVGQQQHQPRVQRHAVTLARVGVRIENAA